MSSQSGQRESIKLVSPEDRSRVIAILTIAFAMCPLLRWLYPEPDRFLNHFTGFLDYYAGDPYADQSGVYFDSDDKGALLWLTDKTSRDDAAMMRFLLSSVPDNRRTETEKLFEEFGKYHPKEPHWYFTMLGIDPMHQRLGLGGLLYQHGLAILDEAKGLAFTEATSLRAARLYERLGWQIVGEVQIGSSPPFFPMLRPSLVSGSRQQSLPARRSESEAKSHRR
ncbi:GNAT family N-acetyltransferase [Bradyrhizobium sp. DASA03076]|uniref:GNAT family N-acetyltransferase n=1 Tax=Bradyrhizobium sp. BLXBL-03 TaxID=3395916 RepID=UPI003F6EFDB3